MYCIWDMVENKSSTRIICTKKFIRKRTRGIKEQESIKPKEKRMKGPKQNKGLSTHSKGIRPRVLSYARPEKEREKTLGSENRSFLCPLSYAKLNPFILASICEQPGIAPKEEQAQPESKKWIAFHLRILLYIPSQMAHKIAIQTRCYRSLPCKRFIAIKKMTNHFQPKKEIRNKIANH